MALSAGRRAEQRGRERQRSSGQKIARQIPQKWESTGRLPLEIPGRNPPERWQSFGEVPPKSTTRSEVSISGVQEDAGCLGGYMHPTGRRSLRNHARSEFQRLFLRIRAALCRRTLPRPVAWARGRETHPLPPGAGRPAEAARGGAARSRGGTKVTKQWTWTNPLHMQAGTRGSQGVRSVSPLVISLYVLI